MHPPSAGNEPAIALSVVSIPLPVEASLVLLDLAVHVQELEREMATIRAGDQDRSTRDPGCAGPAATGTLSGSRAVEGRSPRASPSRAAREACE